MDRTMKLLFSNIPVHCPDDLLRDWIEAHGYRTFGVRLMRDREKVGSTSFAYVQLIDSAKLDEACRALDGQILWGRTIRVRLVAPRSSLVRSASWEKTAV
jgi:hypothetical protein